MRVSRAVAGFLLGLAVGALGGRFAFRFHHRPRDVKRIADKFARELKLDAAQAQGVEKLLADYRARVDAERLQEEARLKEIRESLRGEIKKLLKDEQLGKYDDIVARWEARHKSSER